MRWRNSKTGWGAISIMLHWLVALTLFGLFGLGLWMTGLDYYDPWYRRGPDLHRSIGVILFLAILIRIGWRFLNTTPVAMFSHKRWEVKAAHITHGLLHLLPLLIMISGYLISTADGRSVSVFGWFEIPALFTAIEQQEEVMGTLHEILAWLLMSVIAIHVAGALKHHFIDLDNTLVRMLKTTDGETQ